jgi:polysaccharide export outer membrane protein
MSERWSRRLLVLGLASLALVAGCASRTASVAEVNARSALAPDDGTPVQMRTPGYQLRAGDVLEIGFPSDPTGGYTTPVSPGGTVTVPMIGEVVAAGKTAAELAAEITEVMSQYMVDATSYVILKEVAPQPVFVIGEVSDPGRVDVGQGLTVSMALAEAGGVKPGGRPSSIMVVRTYGVDQPLAIRVDVTKVLSGRDLSEDLRLVANDVVYVPKSVIGKVNEFVDLFFENIAPAQLFYLRGYDMMHLDDAYWRF